MIKKINYRYFLLIIITVSIGYFRYFDPNILRSFGDISPNSSPLENLPGFQFYGINFQENFLPNYYAPYRYQLDRVLYLINYFFHPSKKVVDWISLFLPFLLSSCLSGLFYLKISSKPLIGYLGWLTYIFSTFVIFTSSIHTPIVISLNLILFFYYLLINWLNSENSKLNNTFYILKASLIIIIASIFELRILIISSPFLILIWYSVLSNFNKRTTANYKSLKLILITHLSIIGVTGLNFIYLLLNISSTIQTANLATGRTTWGSNYFQLINTVSLSHPFWNNSQPENFIYNFPSFFYWPNIVITISIFLYSALNFKKMKTWKWLLVGIIVSGFLSKQNNEPFKNIYDYLYQFPYFSLSRESSKYYYSFVIIWSLLLTKILDIHFSKNIELNSLRPKLTKFVNLIILTIILIPVLNSCSILISGKLGNSTVNYPNETDSYNTINDKIIIDKGADFINSNKETRVLWLPLMGTLQDNTKNINHVSYSTLVTLYPLSNIQKISRSYLFESLSDSNIKKYLRLLGFEYIVIPNLSNEPSIKSQMNLSYADFDINRFVNYVEGELPLELNSTINDYKLYKINWPNDENTFTQGVNFKDENQDPSELIKQLNYYNELKYLIPLQITESIVPEQYGEIGNIQLSEASNNQNKIDNILKIIPEKIEPGNCNNNSSRGLDFEPDQRIKISQTSFSFKINLSARSEEIPCINIQFKAPPGYTSKDLFLQIDKYYGNDSEIVVFTKDYPDIIKAEKFFSLKENQNNSLIPLHCPTDNCKFNIYFKGKSLIKTSNATFDLQLVALQNNDLLKKKNTIGIFNKNILDLNSINLSKDSIDREKFSHILFRYIYDPNYRIILENGIEKIPIKNNHGLLLFEIDELNLTNSKLVYKPQVNVRALLKLTDYINYTTLLALFILFITKLIRMRKPKKGVTDKPTPASITTSFDQMLANNKAKAEMRTRKKDLKASIEDFGPEQVKGYDTLQPDKVAATTAMSLEVELENDYPEEGVVPVIKLEDVVVTKAVKKGRKKKTKKLTK